MSNLDGLFNARQFLLNRYMYVHIRWYIKKSPSLLTKIYTKLSPWFRGEYYSHQPNLIQWNLQVKIYFKTACQATNLLTHPRSCMHTHIHIYTLSLYFSLSLSLSLSDTRPHTHTHTHIYICCCWFTEWMNTCYLMSKSLIKVIN